MNNENEIIKTLEYLSGAVFALQVLAISGQDKRGATWEEQEGRLTLRTAYEDQVRESVVAVLRQSDDDDARWLAATLGLDLDTAPEGSDR